MKIAFVVSVPEKRDGDEPNKWFARKLKLLSVLGYNGVELAVRDPKMVDLAKVKKLLNKYRFEVSAIATGSAYSQDYLSLISPFDEAREMAVQRIKEQIKFASHFPLKKTVGEITYAGYPYVIIGLVRGGIRPGMSELQARGILKDSLEECAKFAQIERVPLVIEPINRYETDLLHSVKDVMDFIKEAELKNTYVLADTFHMNIEEVSITDSIIEAAQENLLGHIHLADSNRLAPGQGHLNFLNILATVRYMEYQGFLSVELVPVRPDFETAAKQSIKYLKKLMR